jgi:uncharacterized protein YdeI (BOF family)
MTCNEYQELTAIEKRDYIGSLIHAAINDSDLFKEGQKIINVAIAKGIFEGVVINPANKTELINE